jgi:hypothetical protein
MEKIVELGILLYKQSPLLFILALIGSLVWMWIKNTKQEKKYALSLANIAYLVLFFQGKKDAAENERMHNSLEEAKEMIEEYKTERVCDYRDLIKPIIHAEEYECKIDSPCKTPRGHNLESLFIDVYSKVLDEAFRTVKGDIRRLIKNNGLTHRSPSDFDEYFAKRTDYLFEKVIRYLKKEYDDHKMPVHLRVLLNKIDMDDVRRLGMSIFRRARDHKLVYEDRMRTIEKEENDKMTSFIGGDDGNK